MGVKNNPFFSDGTYWINCPHPDCTHAGDMLTKAHCRVAHEMSREELVKVFGNPTITTKAMKKGGTTNATTHYFV